MDISCSQEVARALCDCAKIIPITPVEDRPKLTQSIEALSRSLEILNRIKEGESDGNS